MLVYLIHKLTCMQFSRYNHWLISLSLTAYMKYKPMGLSGLEPPTSRLSGVRSNQLSYKPFCFRKFFIYSGSHLLSHTVSSAVPSAA